MDAMFNGITTYITKNYSAKEKKLIININEAHISLQNQYIDGNELDEDVLTTDPQREVYNSIKKEAEARKNAYIEAHSETNPGDIITLSQLKDWEESQAAEAKKPAKKEATKEQKALTPEEAQKRAQERVNKAAAAAKAAAKAAAAAAEKGEDMGGGGRRRRRRKGKKSRRKSKKSRRKSKKSRRKPKKSRKKRRKSAKKSRRRRRKR